MSMEDRDRRDADRPKSSEIQKLGAEVFGTFFLAFVETGGAMLAAFAPDVVTPVARAAAAGLLVMAMIYTIGETSGAHMNPAATFAFAMRGVFPWRRVPLYWIAQFTGAVLAALTLQTMLGRLEHLGLPHGPDGLALVMVILLTALLMSVVLGTATHHSVIGANAALGVGGTVALCALFAQPISGASVNPARALASAMVGSTMPPAWIYLAGPLAGAAIAVGIAFLLHGGTNAAERKAATGDGNA